MRALVACRDTPPLLCIELILLLICAWLLLLWLLLLHCLVRACPVGQLSPFYSSSLKPLVTPLLFYLLPVRVDDADVGTKTPPAKETAGAAETASATAPAHPLNAQ